ncbi:MAG TPA: glycosyltransferase [Solirubrobacteraceae bacterium]
MRILAVGSMYPPHHLGGYELAWASAAAALRARGHEVRVLATDFRTGTGEPDEPDTFRELRWYWRDHDWPRISWRGRIELERHNAAVLDRHLRRLEPQLVTWFAMGGMSLALIERVRRAGVPAVAFVHDDWLTYGPSVDRWTAPFRGRPRLAAMAERVTGLPAAVDLDAAVRCVFVSETVRSHARAAGYALPGSSVAHSGIGRAFLSPRAPIDWGWRLLYVGRIDERKGVLDAVAALAQLPPEARLTLAGQGDRRVVSEVRALANRLGVADRVRELGPTARSGLADVYASADAVVFPVRWEEPWGLVPLEAMGIGRPVVATARGGSGEYLLDGSNCVTVPPADPGAIAWAVRQLAGDPDLRTRLRDGGFETARAHTEAAWGDAVVAEVEAAAYSADVAAHHAP